MFLFRLHSKSVDCGYAQPPQLFCKNLCGKQESRSMHELVGNSVYMAGEDVLVTGRHI